MTTDADAQRLHSIEQFFALLPRRRSCIEVTGPAGAERAYLVAGACRVFTRPVCVVLPSTGEADAFLDAFDFFTSRMDIRSHYFPPYNLAPYKVFAYHSETAAARMAALYRIRTEGGAPVVVTTPEAMVQRLIPTAVLNDFAELVMVNETLNRDGLVAKLVSGGYTATPIVEEPGDFSVRGGILDVFSPLYPDPVRIELFGDVVDTMRFFSPTSQRSSRPLDEAILLPAREAVVDADRIDVITTRIRALAVTLGLPVTKIRDLVARLKDSGTLPGLESLLPLLYDDTDTLLSYLPPDTLYYLMEPGAIRKAADDFLSQARINHAGAVKDHRLCAPPEALFVPWDEIQAHIDTTGPVVVRPFSTGPRDARTVDTPPTVDLAICDNHALGLALKAHRDKEHLLMPLRQWADEQWASGCTVLLVCGSRARAERIATLVQPYGIDTDLFEGFPEPDTVLAAGSGRRMAVCTGRIPDGFVWKNARLAIVTEKEVFGGAFQKRKKLPAQVRARLLTIEDLQQNDLVVHQEHGIGRYQGLSKLRLDGATGDFLLVTYRENDKLYLPVDRMNMLQKYMGIDGISVTLDKLGGKSWDRVKERVKRSTEKIAGELLKLYAARQVEKGTAFSLPERLYREFEAAFPYDETQDQRKAIADVLDDMESERPMDRLVCGDVGYGKTEVALRASFVAVNSGKQVAVLVPTTVLAEQHFETFRQRFERHPIIVECLSRFRTAAEQRDIVQRTRDGKVDIVVGTHRLLSKDVIFKDLGLLVLDEEQRFGVKHKEKIKRLRHNVDVLTLTATPIPRTLHLSLMGIRDISVISTPPEQRHPIITYVTEFDAEVAAEAIRKELKRKGQSFFVHNHVSTIHAMADRLRKLVPEARITVAHGQMDEEALEAVMLTFMKREIDVLVCTTIIESGIDISSANTILINRADRFGLSQIYQLRGRVGRSDTQAYAYLFIPADTVMTKDAQKRLKVLMEHSDLGSGFQIAMSDLKIRGGGTILGASQSGHIAAVGYDMFLQLMENSIAERKGEIPRPPLDPEINLPLSAFLPEAYMPDIDQRLAAYRRLARMTEPSELSEFKSEMTDRFGEAPPETVHLFMKMMLRILAIKAGVRRLDLKDRLLLLTFSPDHQQDPLALVSVAQQMPEPAVFTAQDMLKVPLQGERPGARMTRVKNILKEIAQHVNHVTP